MSDSKTDNLASPKRERLSIEEIAKRLNAKVYGDTSALITGIKPLGLAGENDLSFFAPSSKRNLAELIESLRSTKAGAIVVKEQQVGITTTQIVHDNPMQAIIELSPSLAPKAELPKGVDERAAVDPSATIADSARIASFAYVGAGCSIGENVSIHPQAVLYPGVIVGANTVIHAGAVIREFVSLGENCLVQPGAVIGGDGFGYIPEPDGHRRIPHIGNVVLEDWVDVGANSTIDRATLGETRIETQTKLDNLVMIGHNVRIGRQSILCGQVGVSGSAQIGRGVVLGGQAGVADHAHIADGVRAAAKTGVDRNVDEKMDIAGFPWTPALQWRRQAASIIQLPKLIRQIKSLIKRSN